ncbi:MAG TPA: Slp family lipoprotein, partial [Nitrospiraceae bacterium]|nr:Slp family lipoprotein [Nitrospiraceae bacterium]
MPCCIGRQLIPVITLLLGGCGTSGFVVPELLESQVDPSISFQQLLASPDSYQGKMVVVGGEVLKASTTDGGTVLEVLQLPLEEGQRPARERTESQGRFLARQETFLYPATVGDRARITIVGQVTGATTGRLDEVDYRYPTLDIKHLHLWRPEDYAEWPRSGPWW